MNRPTPQDEELALILQLFPHLTREQVRSLQALYPCYAEWNARINVISRKDIEHLYLHHVLHSLSIARFIQFTPGTEVADVGTGGGFPAIPLAILFPQVHFHLIDSVGKKLRVAQAAAQSAEIQNISLHHCRAEDCRIKADFVLSRAAMAMPLLVHTSRHILRSAQRNAIPNGFICLKGGNLEEELAPFKTHIEQVELPNYFPHPYFQTKKLIYLPA